jgi:hypothetical protein
MNFNLSFGFAFIFCCPIVNVGQTYLLMKKMLLLILLYEKVSSTLS